MSKEFPCVYHRTGGVCVYAEEPGFTDYCVYGPCPHEKQSNGDLIRNMDDEDLAKRIMTINEPNVFCKGSQECEKLINTDEDIPEEMCMKCLVKWLQAPADRAAAAKITEKTLQAVEMMGRSAHGEEV